MEIAKTYSPADAEKRWYDHWIKHKFFSSKPDHRTPYTIVIPPPNVTGVLHMGHMLNNTIQDVLIRRARMRGFNACWVPGTDHASIATEAKVVKLLEEQGIKKSSISREKFLEHAWAWKEKYGGIILDQLKKLGASCDWDRTSFTMDPQMTDAVLDVFIDLYNKGLIYRGYRMVNWDPVGLTAVSDEEVFHKETKSKLVYVKYKVEGTADEFLMVATTRPETIMGDTAVCVNPTDERYTHLQGKKVIVPVVNRAVPVIYDEYVDPAFGTGALKVTPAHDINDFNIGVKHKLPVIDALTADGKISEAAGAYVGMDRFACRKKIIADLQEMGLVDRIEEITNKVGYSERTDAVIEPKLSMQWFLKMKDISKPALDAIVNDDVHLIPEKFINTYKHWMENVHDWCISRQLWWGQRIPAWYDEEGNVVACKTKEEAEEKLKALGSKSGARARQDNDVLDTWFSSWLWPLTVFDPDVVKKGWDNANEDLKYYYPTNDLVTAPEILFFWVARMMIAGYEYTGKKPFTNVYLTGVVRDESGRRMSKSLGNSPDPIDLMNIYGADGVRVGVMLPSPAGNDLIFDTPLKITPGTPLVSKFCEQGRNFTNKVWNAYRLIKGFEVGNVPQPAAAAAAIKWFEQKFSEELETINDHFDKYRMSDALKITYRLVWDDFCAWYLEAVKPEFVNGKSLPIDKTTYEATIKFLEKVLRLMHPWTPFITEEIWHQLKKRSEKDCIIIAEWPKSVGSLDTAMLAEFEVCKELVTTVRNVRAQKQMPPKEKLEVVERSTGERTFFDPVVIKLANLSAFNYSKDKIEGASSFVIRTTEFFIPLQGKINKEEERERIRKDLIYNQGFLRSVQIKLTNEKFVAKARPEILANERKKEDDALSKIKTLEEQLAALR